MKVGYARVSTFEQNLDLQTKELEKCGCVKIFKDKISGVKSERPGLENCLKNLSHGDILVVWRLDRLGRSLKDLVSIVSELKDRGIKFKSLRDGTIDTTTASGELIFNIFASLAQFERDLIIERTNAGLKAARARGKTGGRPRLDQNDPRIAAAKRLHADKTIPISDIMKTLNISKATLYRFLKTSSEEKKKKG
ncbi:MAG TPA: recombinase family protein [bacterium]|nr:recombinase family protein [bacterium]